MASSQMNWNAITIGKLNSIERNSSSWGMHRSVRHFDDFFFAQYFEYFECFRRFKSIFRCWYRWIVSLSSDKIVRNLRHIDDFCFAQYFRRFKTFVQWMHRGAFCQFPFRWIYYNGSNKFFVRNAQKYASFWRFLFRAIFSQIWILFELFQVSFNGSGLSISYVDLEMVIWFLTAKKIFFNPFLSLRDINTT